MESSPEQNGQRVTTFLIACVGFFIELFNLLFDVINMSIHFVNLFRVPVHPRVVGGGVTLTFLSAGSEAFLRGEPRGRETSQLAASEAVVTNNSWMRRPGPASGFLQLEKPMNRAVIRPREH